MTTTSSTKSLVLLVFASLLLLSDAETWLNNRFPKSRNLRQYSPLFSLDESFPFSISKNKFETIVPRGGAIIVKKGRNYAQNIARRPDNNEGDGDPANLLILIRIMFFLYYASLGSLLPYLPVYYHSLGHGGQIIGMLGAIKPFTTFLVAPLWGIISDQTGSPFTVLYFTFLVSLVGQLAVSWRHDTYWIMAMVFITAFFNAPVKSLIDSMVMSNIENGKLYGRLRLWGQLGFGVGSSVVGVLLSKSQKAQQQKDAIADTVLTTAAILRGNGTMLEKFNQIWQKVTGYKLLFFAHALLSIPTLICIRGFHRWTKKNYSTTPSASQEGTASRNNRIDESNETKPNVLEGIRVLFHNSDALLFFFLVLVVGISSGVIENFAYVRIREVGGSGNEMGLSRLVSSMAGAPMFWFSGPLTELLGADKVLTLSLINYVFRYFNYAFMQSPLQGLPAEALRGATFAAFWSTCTIYASRVAPPGMQATMLMLLNAMYGGLGQSLGAIIGGKLQSKFGTVKTFIYAGIFDAFFVVVLIAYLSARKGSSFKNPQKIVISQKT
eukprot:CAMPEP_0197190886 /NCGR_PEP_ID=MMETSP1423-20130617/22429_1 /TAXON_ID=476441 /ORGANISM="Pseudo-nitzschia heimii, Strain UNC1101" /LENGTH=551 /DNA_ID=CAMNT_0042643369 /DNA_START=89 /DNA_END=1740 /DNA_ORIENTATION=+